MKITLPISRREFLAATAAATGALALAPSAGFSQASVKKRFPIIAFSKPFRELNAEDTAGLVAEAGWDGIECPVRVKDGQIAPERVEEDLPKMCDALRRHGLELSVLTTEILSLRQPHAEKILRTAARLGVKRYRLGFWKYVRTKPVPAQLEEIRAQLRDLVALNRELGLQAGIQNHSGADMLGAPVWDIHEVIRDFDPRYAGVFFDIGHATIEGTYAWITNAQLVQPRFVGVFLKDFIWEKTAQGWKTRWVPLGEGAVHREFFQSLKKSSYDGPICQHHEYPVGTGAERMQHFKKDLQVLRQWLET